ncbi:unnamed protein product [Orchesella dallaii]|uniref:C2H2-type domain-containing protein n=1 Tax=Orchesella dallaii TaxID=48710 RepID=A0ABP1S9F9_9HEXA
MIVHKDDFEGFINSTFDFERRHASQILSTLEETTIRRIVKLSRLFIFLVQNPWMKLCSHLLTISALVFPHSPMNFLRFPPGKYLMNLFPLITESTSIISKILGWGFQYAVNWMAWAFFVKVGAVMDIQIAVGAVLIRVYMAIIKRKWGKCMWKTSNWFAHQIRQTASTYRQIQILLKFLNGSQSNIIMSLLICSAIAKIFSAVKVIQSLSDGTFVNPDKIPLNTFLTQAVVYVIVAVLAIFGICGQIHESAKECLAEMNNAVISSGRNRRKLQLLKSKKIRVNQQVFICSLFVCATLGGIQFIQYLFINRQLLPKSQNEQENTMQILILLGFYLFARYSYQMTVHKTDFEGFINKTYQFERQHAYEILCALEEITIRRTLKLSRLFIFLVQNPWMKLCSHLLTISALVFPHSPMNFLSFPPGKYLMNLFPLITESTSMISKILGWGFQYTVNWMAWAFFVKVGAVMDIQIAYIYAKEPLPSVVIGFNFHDHGNISVSEGIWWHYDVKGFPRNVPKYIMNGKLKIDNMKKFSLKYLEKISSKSIPRGSLNLGNAYWKAPSYCEEILKPIKLSSYGFEPLVWLPSCYDAIFLKHRNFSINGVSWTRFSSEIKLRRLAMVPNACEYFGYRYLTMIHMKSFIQRESMIDFSDLLSPFSFSVWMVLIVSSLLIAVNLLVLGSKRSFFSTVTTLLEQGGCNEEFPEPEPSIPENFHRLLDDENHAIVGDSVALRTLVYTAGIILNETRNPNNSFLNKLFHGRLKYFKYYEEKDEKTGKYMQYSHNLIKRLAQGKSVNISQYLDDKSRFPSPHPIEKSNLIQFSYVYSHPSEFTGRAPYGFREEYAVAIFAGRRIFTNTERLLFANLEGYYGTPNLRLREVFKNNLKISKNFDFVNLASNLVPDVRRLRSGLDLGMGIEIGKSQLENELLIPCFYQRVPCKPFELAMKRLTGRNGTLVNTISLNCLENCDSKYDLYQHILTKNFVVVLSNLNDTNQLPDFTNQYLTLLAPSHHLKSCLAQLPTFLNSSKDITTYLTKLKQHKQCCAPNFVIYLVPKWTRVLSDYIIEYIYAKEPLPSVVIGFNFTDNGNISVSEGIWGHYDVKGFPRNVPKYIMNGKLKIDNIEKISLEYLQKISAKSIPRGSLNLGNTYWKAPSYCEEILKPIKLSSYRFEPLVWLPSCYDAIFLKHRNFSINGVSWTRFSSEIKLRRLAMVPNACEYFGYRYLTMVHMKSFIQGESMIDFSDLLSPFTFSVWLVLIVSSLLIAVNLLVLGSNRSFFSTVTTLLEQGGCNEEFRDWRRCRILIIWVFTTYLLRNFYTSSMYSFLTAEPEPSIPENFHRLLDDENHAIVGDSVALRTLVYTAGIILNETRNPNNSFLNKLFHDRLKYFKYEEEKDEYTGKHMQYSHNLIKRLAQGKSVNVWQYIDDNSRSLSQHPKEKSNLIKFSYVYSHPSHFISRAPYGFREEFAVAIFAGRRIFTNTERLLFSTLDGYYGVPTLRLKEVNIVLGLLRQSGVLNHLTDVHTYKKVTKQLIETFKVFKNNLKISKNFDFVNLASNLVPDVRRLRSGLDLGMGIEIGKSQLEEICGDGDRKRSKSVDSEGEEAGRGGEGGIEEEEKKDSLELEMNDEHGDEDSIQINELEMCSGSGRATPPPPRLEREVPCIHFNTEVTAASKELPDTTVDCQNVEVETFESDPQDESLEIGPTTSLTSDADTEGVDGCDIQISPETMLVPGEKEGENGNGPQTLTNSRSEPRYQCVTCDMIFDSNQTLHSHCNSFAKPHGKRCPTISIHINSKSYWKRHIEKCSYPHDDDMNGDDDDFQSDDSSSSDEAQPSFQEDVERTEDDVHDEIGARSPTSSLTSDAESGDGCDIERGQKVHQCVTCDEEFASIPELYEHCNSFEERHGKLCRCSQHYFNSKGFWERHLTKCPYRQDDVLDGARKSARSRRKNKYRVQDDVEENQGNVPSPKKTRCDSDKDVRNATMFSPTGIKTKKKVHQRASSKIRARPSEQHQCVTCNKQFKDIAELYLHCKSFKIRHGMRCSNPKSMRYYNSTKTWKIHMNRCPYCRKKGNDGGSSVQTPDPPQGPCSQVPNQNQEHRQTLQQFFQFLANTCGGIPGNNA